MKTIAISIEEDMLSKLRELAVQPIEPGGPQRRSISELVRLALRDYLARCEKKRRENQDRIVFARHRKLLRRQAEVLMSQQAKP